MRGVCRLVVTCEHGGNRVPPHYARLFRGKHALLDGHRGYDPGSLEIARTLARRFRAPLVASVTTRLLVDLNRSPTHRALFSEITRSLGRLERNRILERHYYPHRERVEAVLSRRVRAGARVLHVAAHTFTPVLDDQVRSADIGLLYDPRRRPERSFARRWQLALERLLPELRIRRNTPYRGAADGLTTALRRQFPASRYLGLEIEVSQRFLAPRTRAWREIQEALVVSLQKTLDRVA